MPTLLTNGKMNPALAARVEASVRGRRGVAVGRAVAPRLVAVARLALLTTIVLAVGYLVVNRRRDRQNLESERQAILDAVHAQRASLTVEDTRAVARAESWIMRFSGVYEGDVVAAELRGAGALPRALARPALYVRGPLGELAAPGSIAETAAASAKDAFLLCLVDPPPSRTEKVLLGKVRAAYSGGALVEQATAHVRRLHEAKIGLPLLLPPFEERVRAAKEAAELARLKRELERAPLERAKQALRAEVLIVVIDEANDPGGPTELDGEHAHQVRIGIVDVASGNVLLRMRKRVDPSWISQAKRPDYASGLDSCALAIDVREGV